MLTLRVNSECIPWTYAIMPINYDDFELYCGRIPTGRLSFQRIKVLGCRHVFNSRMTEKNSNRYVIDGYNPHKPGRGIIYYVYIIIYVLCYADGVRALSANLSVTRKWYVRIIHTDTTVRSVGAWEFRCYRNHDDVTTTIWSHKYIICVRVWLCDEVWETDQQLQKHVIVVAVDAAAAAIISIWSARSNNRTAGFIHLCVE